ncbi:hypothetical protein KY290_021984 [Solanum tuberosum]|uniref:NAC transcription factor n=1 Tax=Solanum tuberosum TaxID=4113 RepID=A0ABQ7V349_SOLTU|nr:hypothetical protein KY289_021142 [Solanum tuberosum]KAH0758491.1 hypothetical protein KY290_021984 [Solanum tuberosum]
MSKPMRIHFHPIDTELIINYLKKFFKGELSLNQQCPIQFADIYGDQPPWEIFGANFEEKFRQTGEHLIRRNHMGHVVGFKRNFKFETMCRIKKKLDKEKNLDQVMEAQDGDVAVIIDPMLLESNHNNDYSTTEDQVRVCDEQDAVEATTSEYDVQNSTYEATTVEKREAMLEVQEGHGVDDIRSDEFQKEMHRTFEDIPDDWLQNSLVLQDI